ncbi:MAG TPA: 4Fe-4S dicluster domain-containing protein [Tepidisphaeraceae bacterium]|jgi:electron transport complex protein RnfC
MKYFDVQITRVGGWSLKPREFRTIAPAPRLFIPLAAHDDGSTAAPKAPGTIVAAGEPITSEIGETLPAALSPVAGIVRAATTITLTCGRQIPAVEVEATDTAAPEPDPINMTQAEKALPELENVHPADLFTWIDRIRHAGITAHRKTSPDFLAQLHQSIKRPVDTILCNALDEDGSARLNSVAAARWSPAMIVGLVLLARLTGAKRNWIIIEGESPGRWWRHLKRLAGKRVQLVSLRNDYPQPDPTLLLHTVVDRRLRPGRSPVEQGLLVLDPPTAAAIGECAALERPMLRVPIVLRDDRKGETHLLLVAVGTPLSHVLKELAIPSSGVIVRAGHALRDIRVPADVILAGGELTLHIGHEEAPNIPEPCIRCSWCIEACPTQIQPAGLLEASQRGDLALADHYGLEACIECGLCSHVCPSRLPLLEGIRRIKLRGEAVPQAAEHVTPSSDAPAISAT